jgi:hypothetical protein
MNVLAVVEAPFKFVGKVFIKASVWVPRVFKIEADVQAAAPTVLPEAIQVFTGIENLVAVATKDGAEVLPALEAFAVAVAGAVASKLTNPLEDVAVVTSIEGVVKAISASGVTTDVFSAIKQVVSDFEKFGASVGTVLNTLEKDATT